ncbi:MAG TPA: DJ-1/PfpI family protein [Streptomyces sp.]|uniref:DJ-1/PfpI family protein n=1 Tax=Streptomyces sp. TaxID=1931 RepID=UPI002B538A5A|nr:DJ-1/PfpI family protein [Streptomyces sp.]HWU06750.1 DJ-1/PfpI family protein [Streptomyces sp.]
MTGTAVRLAVHDTFADWEPGFATAQLTRHGRTVRTVGLTTAPVTTMGGMRVQPDLSLGELTPGDSELLILTGASLRDTGDTLAPFAREIFGLLGVFEPERPEKPDAWYRLFHDSDARAYEVLER